MPNPCVFGSASVPFVASEARVGVLRQRIFPEHPFRFGVFFFCLGRDAMSATDFLFFFGKLWFSSSRFTTSRFCPRASLVVAPFGSLQGLVFDVIYPPRA